MTRLSTEALLVTKSLGVMTTLSRARSVFVAAAGLAGEDVTAGAGLFGHGGSLVGAAEVAGLCLVSLYWIHLSINWKHTSLPTP